MTEATQKRCKTCKVEKPLGDFENPAYGNRAECLDSRGNAELGRPS